MNPTIPNPPIGMRSPRPRKASAPMVASAANVTQSIGTMAKLALIINLTFDLQPLTDDLSPLTCPLPFAF